MSRILQNYFPPHNRFLMSKNCFRNFQKHWSINFALFLENLLPLRPFLVTRVGNRGWRSKALWRKKSRRKLCARAPWSDRWVPAKILEMYRCHQLLLCKFVKMSSNTTLQVLFVRGAAVSSRPQFFLTRGHSNFNFFWWITLVSESVPDNLSGMRASNHQTLSDQKKKQMRKEKPTWPWYCPSWLGADRPQEDVETPAQVIVHLFVQEGDHHLPEEEGGGKEERADGPHGDHWAARWVWQKLIWEKCSRHQRYELPCHGCQKCW